MHGRANRAAKDEKALTEHRPNWGGA